MSGKRCDSSEVSANYRLLTVLKPAYVVRPYRIDLSLICNLTKYIKEEALFTVNSLHFSRIGLYAAGGESLYPEYTRC